MVQSPYQLGQSAALEYLLPTIPAGPGYVFTVQMIWALNSPMSCDPGGFVLSPGLVITT